MKYFISSKAKINLYITKILAFGETNMRKLVQISLA